MLETIFDICLYQANKLINIIQCLVVIIILYLGEELDKDMLKNTLSQATKIFRGVYTNYCLVFKKYILLVDFDKTKSK